MDIRLCREVSDSVSMGSGNDLENKDRRMAIDSENRPS